MVFRYRDQASVKKMIYVETLVLNNIAGVLFKLCDFNTLRVLQIHINVNGKPQ